MLVTGSPERGGVKPEKDFVSFRRRLAGGLEISQGKACHWLRRGHQEATLWQFTPRAFTFLEPPARDRDALSALTNYRQLRSKAAHVLASRVQRMSASSQNCKPGAVSNKAARQAAETATKCSQLSSTSSMFFSFSSATSPEIAFQLELQVRAHQQQHSAQDREFQGPPDQPKKLRACNRL